MVYDNVVCKEQLRPQSYFELPVSADNTEESYRDTIEEAEIEGFLHEVESGDMEFDGSVVSSISDQIRSYKLLTVEQERYYVELLHSDCKEKQKMAKDALVLHNMRLVYSVARRYDIPGLTLDDLVQEGVIGLMQAIDRYDPNISKFSTYAVHWIRQAVRRAISTQDRIIRLPTYMYDRVLKMKSIQSELISLNIEITDEILAQKMGLSIVQVRDIQRVMQDVLSLNQILTNEDGGNAELGDYVEDINTQAPDDNIIGEDMRYQIDLAMESLTSKERNVINLYYGLDSGSKRTLDSIGKQMGITRERVRQIKLQALKKLRSPKNQKILGSPVFDTAKNTKGGLS